MQGKLGTFVIPLVGLSHLQKFYNFCDAMPRQGNRGMRYRLKLLKQTRAVETVRYGSVYLRLAMSGM